MILIDGSQGEGGGQMLRSALTLSLVTGQAFRIKNIRAGRKKPGLLRQHLTATKAAIEIGHADAKGAELGSQELEFRPNGIHPGNYSFAIGSAGSCTLVFQTVFPALMLADGESSLVCEGGTHNPFAPCYDFIANSFLPQIEKMGCHVTTQLDRHGFYPAGGGRFSATISPSKNFSPLELRERGELISQRLDILLANIHAKVGWLEKQRFCRKTEWTDEDCHIVDIKDPVGPGNAMIANLNYENVSVNFISLGERNRRSEAVADSLARSIKQYTKRTAPVCEHLADQLLIPMALGAGGVFRTGRLTQHTLTNIEIIQRFLDVKIDILSKQETEITVTS